MAGFIYYFPGVTLPVSSPSKVPDECNLASVFADGTVSYSQTDRGPDLNMGQIAVLLPAAGSGGAEASARYDQAKQTWEKVEVRQPDGTLKVTHWIGYENDSPPEPKDLVRQKSVQGWPIEMRGHEWVIPTIHLPLTTLPMRYRMTPDGPMAKVSDEYEALCSEAAEWREKSEQDKAACVYSFLSKCIGVNYRVGPWELGILGVLDSATCIDCLRAVFGMFFVEAESDAQKKTLTRPVGG